MSGGQDPRQNARVGQEIGDPDVLRFLRPGQNYVSDGLTSGHGPSLCAQLNLVTFSRLEAEDGVGGQLGAQVLHDSLLRPCAGSIRVLVTDIPNFFCCAN